MNQVAERKRKFFLMVPIFVIPLACLFFYGLGGGKKSERIETVTGLNASVPGAQLGEEGFMDKLSLYRQAEKDSQLLREASDADTYAWKDSPVVAPYSQSPASPGAAPTIFSTPGAGMSQNSEAKIQQRLQLLEQLVQHGDTSMPSAPAVYLPTTDTPDPPAFSATTPKEKDVSSGDPELVQLEGMLEKIIDIQHPERLQEKLKQASLENQAAAFAVTTTAHGQPIAEVFESEKTMTTRTVRLASEQEGFFELAAPVSIVNNNAVSAVVHESQTLVSGATVKMRLEQNAYVQGVLIPAGSFVYGHCQLQSDRLQIAIPSIRYGNSIFPVSLQVYDSDGLPGIRIPGSVNRDAAKEGSQQAMQALAMGSLDPSLGAQAASAGIETAKSLLSKKIRLIKVTVKADHPVLLVSK
ncbi:conjugative transposon protein TraM [Chitinophaga sp. S165]|uniref:conjugative transposon protein TraM n=1 Tax=Chitinophaga sp. S165 TaxID=2135462 RepID=UPI000D713AD7|nr:conjugative transposon protein TraM [Chitinophaga sp. S165]PWV47138.1 conjugative transposon TraM protein [Chitinophaga sp. S165]